ncbi:MAG: anaerobic ribonucleoside-triphosphate reductase activating protein [Eggerthellaceae bacterium]|nr:anaerobic ribonucleoside-triphosphate reductase activating protein [Eggerthellaceae bacterium]
MVENEKEPQTISLYGTVNDSIVDGPGLRFAVFVQGCSHHCPGCHNPKSQPKEGGVETSIDELVETIASNRSVHDVTLSGGEPFEQAEACAVLARKLKARGYGLWAYSGYLYEQLIERAEAGDEAVAELLELVDVLVDGPFVEALKSYDLEWKGSSNQRVIDLKKTRQRGTIVLWSNRYEPPARPASW